MLEVFGDFFIPLMRILNGLPNRAGKSSDVITLFEQTYRNEIAPHQYTENNSGNIRWVHNVRWSREKLKLLGFIDAPQSRIWRLTEEGHQWLIKNPDATRLEKVDGAAKIRSNSKSFPVEEKQKKISSYTKVEFFNTIQNKLTVSVKPIFGLTSFDFLPRSNYLQVRIDGFSGCHYEIILHRKTHEIAIHFESIAEKNKERLFVFVPHLERLGIELGREIYSGLIENRGWRKVAIDLPLKQISDELAIFYSDLTVQFVKLTYPILQSAYLIPQNKRKKKADVIDNSIHLVLDHEVLMIRDYLQGSSALQPTAEKICDWVNFCYIFGMYVEGKDLFSLVNRVEGKSMVFRAHEENC